METKTFLENLQKRGYQVSSFATKEEAAEYLNKVVDQTSVGIASSVTLDDLGLYDKLKTHNEVWWHWRVPAGMSDREVRFRERGTSVYISSVNGAAETGELVNIDNTGNRVAETCYGHDKVFLVFGRNKVAENLEKAIERARNVAAPKNVKRMNREGTPCAFSDHCFDCQSPDRICRILMVFWEKPRGAQYEVVYIDEELGY